MAENCLRGNAEATEFPEAEIGGNIDKEIDIACFVVLATRKGSEHADIVGAPAFDCVNHLPAMCDQVPPKAAAGSESHRRELEQTRHLGLAA